MTPKKARFVAVGMLMLAFDKHDEDLFKRALTVVRGLPIGPEWDPLNASARTAMRQPPLRAEDLID